MPFFHRVEPALHRTLWGGRRLYAYGKGDGVEPVGESWEISFLPEGESTVEGIPLSRRFPHSTWGTACEGLPHFPVLTKFIDAADKLSVQVHPSDAYAMAHGGGYGKTEMWYIVQATPDAGIFVGLRTRVTAAQLRAAVADGTVESLLAFHPVRAGQAYLIPAGTVHAIGAGVTVYEIQQSSATTYRLYDYGRRDASGALRELHVEQALAVAELTPDAIANVREIGVDKGICIGKCKYFLTKEYRIAGKMPLFVGDDSYLILTVVEGYGVLTAPMTPPVSVRAGDSFFLPAGCGRFAAEGGMTLLTVQTPADWDRDE